jgi:hypothetical protein
MVGGVVIAAGDIALLLGNGSHVVPALGLTSMVLILGGLGFAEYQERNGRAPSYLHKPPSFRREVIIPWSLGAIAYIIGLSILLGIRHPFFLLAANLFADAVTWAAFWLRYRIWLTVPGRATTEPNPDDDPGDRA